MTVKSLVVIDGEKIEIKDLKDKEAFADRVNRQVLQSRNYEETGYLYEKMSNEEFASFVVRMHRYIMQKVREVEDRETREKLYLQSVVRTVRAEKYDFTAEQTAKLIEIMTDPDLFRPKMEIRLMEEWDAAVERAVERFMKDAIEK